MKYRQKEQQKTPNVQDHAGEIKEILIYYNIKVRQTGGATNIPFEPRLSSMWDMPFAFREKTFKNTFLY